MFRRPTLAAMAICLCTICAILLPVPPVGAAIAQTQPAGKSVIAIFNINSELSEQPVDDLSAALSGTPGISLRDVVMHMKKAAADPAVKAVVILTDGGSFGIAQTEEIRQAVQKVRAAGKDIYAHSDSLMMGEYLLLCGASRLSISPTGDLWLTGIHGDAPYLHGLLDKMGIQPDFLHCGAYKSASEIFMRDGPSTEADAMENWLLDSVFETGINLIATGRNVSAEQAHKWIDQGPYTAERAKTAGLIDAVETREDFEAALKSKFGGDAAFEKHYGVPKQPELDLSNPFALMRTLADLMAGPKTSENQKNAIGVVYVDGMIVLGQNDGGAFSSAAAASTDISRALDEAAADDSIKAVVLRIDSPGGSATASEIILAATQRLKEKKPLIVSMGNVAGSGGYYVTCAADTIFADQSTITASIGVVGGKLATTSMWNKIGVTFKAYNRGENAGLLSSDAIFSPSERQHMQAWMDEIYGVFKGHVVAARGSRLKKPIDDLAAGRVFTGKQALELGLVDKIGTLSDAIDFAAGQVKISDYDVRTVPQPRNFLQKIMEKSGGADNEPNHVTTAAARISMGGNSDSLLKLAAPYLAGIDPQHARLIFGALEQLQLMQHEGVVLTMPAWATSATMRDSRN
jgi:protease-4